MSALPLPFEPDPEARAARRLAVAQRLVEMGLEVAEAVQRRALAEMADEAARAEEEDDGGAKGRRADPVARVERAARMVRLSLALEARLDEGEPDRRARLRAEAKARRAAEAEAAERAMAAERGAALVEAVEREAIAIDAVVTTLRAAGADRREIDDAARECTELLHEGEREFDLSEQPIGAVIARLCETLEIEADWSVWAEEDWAIEEARTKAPGSPYAAGGVAGGDGAPAVPEMSGSSP